MVGKVYKGGCLIKTMEIKEIIKHLEDEKENVLKGIANNDMILTEVLVHNLNRIKSITKTIRELKEKDIKILLEEYKKEYIELESAMSNDYIPLAPNFMMQTQRFKIINDVIEMSGKDKKLNTKTYVG